MNIIKNIFHNWLMGFDFVQSVAQKFHVTGRNENADEVNRIFDSLKTLVPVAGKSILELGPGQTFGLLRCAHEYGAYRLAALDVIDYRTCHDDVFEFKHYDGRTIPYKDKLFDIIWAYDVMEHVRYPETTVNEIARVMVPGGYCVFHIDLVDHYHIGSNDPIKRYNCLRYSNWLWNLMTWNRSAYVNRLRLTDWLTLFDKHGLDVQSLETEEDPEIKVLYNAGRASFLSRYDKQDAIMHKMKVVLQRRNDGAV